MRNISLFLRIKDRLDTLYFLTDFKEFNLKQIKKIEHRSLILEPQLILSSRVSYSEGDFANAMWLPIFLRPQAMLPSLRQHKQKESDYIFEINSLHIPHHHTEFKT